MAEELITSPTNPKLKQLRKLARTRERARSGLFVAEGEDLVSAARAAGRSAVYGFYAAGAAVGGDLPGFEALAPGLLANVSTLGSGTRVVGVYEQRLEKHATAPLCVYLHGLGDPGNVGAVLRSALAFGASSVALGAGCADPHSPKAVRASMGAIFALRLARVREVRELPGVTIALAARAGEPLWDMFENDCHARARGTEKTDTTPDGSRLASPPGSVPVFPPVPHPGSDPVPHPGSDPVPHPDSDPVTHPGSEPVTHLGTDPVPHPGSGPTAAPGITLLIGAEREGLPEQVLAACDRVAHIPIAGDSLNAAMAATVALYEITRKGLMEEGPAGAGGTLASGSHPRSGQPAFGRLRQPLGKVPAS